MGQIEFSSLPARGGPRTALAMAAQQGLGIETAVDAGGFQVIYRQGGQTSGQEGAGLGGYSIFNEVLTENLATSTTVALTEDDEAGQ